MTDQEKKKNIILLFVTLMVTMLLASLGQMIFSSALPTIVGELSGVEHMTWVITAYMLASTIMMPVYGKLSDLWGRRPLLIVAIALFVTGSIFGAMAGSMTGLIVARVIQGLGAGGLMILSQAAVADVIPARDRGKYMGIMGGVFAVSSVAGPLIGGWLTEGAGWRWAFLLNIPLGALALAAVIILMRLPKPDRSTKPRIDYIGMVLLSTATAAIILATTWGGSDYAWNSPMIIGLFAGAIVAAVLFVNNELRAQEPIMPMKLFKEKNFILVTIAGLLMSVAMFGVIAYMPTYFQMAVGASASVAGLLLAPMMGAMLLTSVVSGMFVSRTGKYKHFPIAGAFVLAVGLTLLATVTIETPTVLICTFMAIIGMGLGATMQILTLIVQNTFPHKMVGTATASNNYFRQVGSSFGTAVVGTVFAASLTRLIAEKLPQGMGGSAEAGSLTPQLLASLPDALRLPIIEAYNGALVPIFAYLVPLAIAAGIILLFVREKALAEKVERDVPAESLAEGEIVAAR